MNFPKFQTRIFNLKNFFSFVQNKPILNSHQKCVSINLTATIQDFATPPVAKSILFFIEFFFQVMN
jgi:hypothetical protein